MQFVQTLTHLVDTGAYDPKMNALESAVVQHFQGKTPSSEDHGVLGAAAAASSAAKPGRVIVFTNYRESVNSVLEMFSKHKPLISARWVGQSFHGQNLMICPGHICISKELHA